MKAARGSIGRSLDQPDPAIRLYLFHGPDEGQSRALGERLLKALGASRYLLNARAIRPDPAAGGAWGRRRARARRPARVGGAASRWGRAGTGSVPGGAAPTRGCSPTRPGR